MTEEEERGFSDAQRGMTACPYAEKDRYELWSRGHDKAFDGGHAPLPRFSRKASGKSRGMVPKSEQEGNTMSDNVLLSQDTTQEAEEKAEREMLNNDNVALRKAACTRAPLRFKGTEKLHIVGDGNPRRQGSHGYNSLQLIIDNPGITVADYREKGGRLNDLRWDIEHGNCRFS